MDNESKENIDNPPLYTDLPEDVRPAPVYTPDADASPRHIVQKLSTGLIVTILLISLLVGGTAGIAGGFYVIRHAKNFAAQGASQNIVVNEDDAVIDVVQKASPAVVSIVISKNVNQDQSLSDNSSGTDGNAGNNSGDNGNDSDNLDPFSNPFFIDPFYQNRSQDNQQNTTPQTAPQTTTPDYEEVGAGSGFFVTSDGLILTNKHVVSDTTAQYTVSTEDGKSYDATVVARDPVNDLALVKIKITNAPTLSLADSSKIQIGQRVIAIGNSLGQYHNTVTTGIVSGIGRNIVAGSDEGTSEQLEGVIQTDAAINPGNSGGPLLNASGDVIGMNTAIDQEGQLVGFAIPINEAAKDIQSYQKKGSIVKPFLGIRYIELDQTIQKQYNLPVANGAWVKANPDNTSSDDNTPFSAFRKRC